MRGRFDFVADQSDPSGIGGYAEEAQMGNKTMNTPNRNDDLPAPRDEDVRPPLANLGMQWLIVGLAPGVDFLAGTDTRAQAIDFIETERPSPDRHDFFAIIKARDLFGERSLATTDAGDAEPIDEDNVLEWLAMRFRPSELEAFREECRRQSVGDEEDVAKIALIDRAIERVI